MYKAVIFDFDGTICDTGEGIKKSAKYALDAYNIPSGEWQTLDYFIGPPLLVTFQEKFSQSPTDADKLVRKFRERYTNTGLYECKLYDEIPTLLSNLKQDGIKLGIASSKPIDYVKKLLEKFDILKYFDAVCAVSFTADCESKQNIIARCLAELDVRAVDAVVAGDRYYDIDGAKANLVDTIGVSWGYASKFEFIECGAKFIAEKPQDIESVALGMFERTENVKKIYNGRVLTMHVDDITLCDGNKADRECVDHPGGVAVIGITDDGDVLLVRQFRYPYKETIYEIPAGKLEKGENPFDAGVREFREETGAVAEKYTFLGDVYPSPGYTNEIIRLYAAENITFGEQDLDDDEFLQVRRVKFDKLISMIMNNEVKDAKTIAAAFKLKEMLKK